jgi:hypothetical protein
MDKLGFFVNSWMHRDWFRFTFGSEFRPVFHNSTPAYDRALTVTPRFVHIIPSSPDGHLDLVAVLTDPENEMVINFCKRLDLLE